MQVRARVLAAAMIAAVALPGQAPAQPADQSSPEEEATMAAYEAYAAPGEAHRTLTARVGSWHVAMSFWMAPGAPPQVSEASAEVEALLDGRFILERFSGMTPFGPFEGIGITGYDNLKKRYVSTWMDSLGTGILSMEGISLADPGVITFSGEAPDPVTGRTKPIRSVDRQVDNRTHRFEIFERAADGTEYCSMELVYTRKPPLARAR